MKHLSKILFIIFIFIISPLAFVHADDLKSDKFEIELVGMPDPADPNDLDKEKPTRDPDYVKGNDKEPGSPQIPKDPYQYDPNNPYAEWER